MVSEVAAARFALLRQLFDLAREQRQALDTDDLVRFESILDERQVLLDQLAEFDDGDDSLPQNVVAFPGAEVNEAEDDLALDTVIRGILDQDQRNAAALAMRMDQIRDQLPALALGGQTAGAYRVSVAGSRVIDRRL